MEKNPSVSVLVPAYNAAPYVLELCQSLQKQTFADFEVILLNDASTDATLERLRGLGGDARFQVLHWDQNKGLHRALAFLLRQARGRYWCSPGADDVLDPRFLECRVRMMDRHPNAVLIHGRARIIDETGREVTKPFPQLRHDETTPGTRALTQILQHNYINQPSVLARRCFTDILFPQLLGDWKFAPDWFLWVLHLSTGYDVLWDEEPLLYYRVHGQSLTHRKGFGTVRNAETRLVPLCALSRAAGFSPSALALWNRWRGPLYQLWLRRALKLSREEGFQPEWVGLAKEAYVRRSTGPARLEVETLRHAAGILRTSWREKRAARGQSFVVSGVAEIDDPLFQAGGSGRGDR